MVFGIYTSGHKDFSNLSPMDYYVRETVEKNTSNKLKTVFD